MLKLVKIEKSPAKFKKYRADVILDGELYRNVDFGDTRHMQFKDSTPLKLYSHLDHNDIHRLHMFHARHAKNNGIASLLSKKYLW